MLRRFSFFFGCLLWSTALGATYVLIPIAARNLGASNAAIGSIIAAPILLQFMLNLTGGLFADRFGSKALVIASSLCLSTCGAVASMATDLQLLVPAQFALVVARAVFWSPAWAMASQLEGGPEKNLGTANAVTNFGQMVGPALGGFLVAQMGTKGALTIEAAFALGALIIFSLSPAGARKATTLGQVFGNYKAIVLKSSTYYAMLTAFLAGTAFSLGFSFLPLLLLQYGANPSEVGVLVACRAGAAIVFGLVSGRLIFKLMDRRRWFFIGNLLQAAGVGWLAVGGPLLLEALPVLLLGFGSAAVTLHYQLVISKSSDPSSRASTFAFAGMGWGMSHALIPASIGLLSDAWGIRVAFAAVSLGLLLILTLTALAWAPTARTSTAAS